MIRPVRRLLLVSHRPIDQAGGPAARWRSFSRHLPEHGWEVDVVSAAGADEFASPEKAQRRARVMETAGKLADPVFRLAGLRPEAMPLSMLWVRRGQRRDAPPVGHRPLRRRPRDGAAVLGADRCPPGRRRTHRSSSSCATSGPETRRSIGAGRCCRASSHGSWAEREALVGVTPEAADDLQRRHPAARVEEIPNGFEPALVAMRTPPSGGTTILHSGTLTKDRPLEPLLRALRPPLRLVLHGYVAPEIRAEIERSGAEVELVQPSGWEEAVRRMADADVALVTQGRGAGDETAVAAKVYEYLALGKPVLCLSHGGATESLLRRLGADQLVARLDDQASIEAALGQDHGRRPAVARASGEARALRAPAPSRASRRPARRARRLATARARRRFAPTPCRPRAAGRSPPSRARPRAGPAPRRSRFGSSPRRVFVPSETVIGRSVFARSVKHGSPR